MKGRSWPLLPRPRQEPLLHHRRIEAQRRSRPVAQPDDPQLGGVRVDPAAVDVEAHGDLPGGHQSVGVVVAAEKPRDLARDRADGRRVQ
ncbi:MAG: hypothetical protein M3P50_00500 [Actinomycetota bacterium]|nr:hypothetical protein [Actinomycetota bacterium]